MAEEVSVLAAAVDGLCPATPSSSPQTGFSVLCGSLDDILPGLWTSQAGPLSSSTGAEPSVAVSLNPLLGDASPLQVTVPLANTVFQNGRPFTLLASRYRRQPTGSYKLVDLSERRTQLIVPGSPSIQSSTSISALLLPLLRPRQIVSGLGNIVRQVDVDGRPTPASKELEDIIPKFFEARARADGNYVPGPIGVWALVLPEEVVKAGLIPTPSDGGYAGAGEEHAKASEVASCFPKLLASGCRLHKIRKFTYCISCPTIDADSGAYSERRRRMGVEAGPSLSRPSDQLRCAWRGRC